MLYGAAPGHVAATRTYFFDLLSPDELDVLSAVYERVLDNLARAGVSPSDDPCT